MTTWIEKYKFRLVQGIELIVYSMIIGSGYIPPEFAFVFAYFSFVIPFVIVLLMARLIWLIWVKDLIFVFFGILFLVSFFLYGQRFFGFGSNYSSTADIKVLTFNLGAFKAGGNKQIQEKSEVFLDFIENEQIDIICFQEFSFVTRNLISDLKELGYSHTEVRNPLRPKQRVRTIIFSKTPIETEELLFSDSTEIGGATATIISNGNRLRIVSTHIKSFNVKSNHPFVQEGLKGGVKSLIYILNRLKDNSLAQLRQLENILHQTENSENVLICGDFNTIPSSYLYTLIRSNHKNAFEEAGFGFGFTYLGKTLFFLRIDQQFYRGNLRATQVTNHDFGFSDHKAVYARYSYK